MKRVVSLVCLFVIAAVVTAAPRAASAKPSVAVLGLELRDDGSGIDERSATIARLLTEALRRRARAASGPYTLMAGSDKELGDAILFGGCKDSSDKECIIKIGAEMGTDFLIYGSLSKQGKGFQVALTLLDIGKKQVRTLPDTIPASDTGDIALERWGKSLYGRLTGQSSKGSLVVTANVQTGQVFINGRREDDLVNGKAKISGIDEGQVKIRVESSGEITEQMVKINAGEETAVDIRLQQKTGIGDGVGGPGLGGDGSDAGGSGDGIGKNISIEGGVSEGRPGGAWRKVFWGSTIVAGVAGGVWAYSFAQYKFLNDNKYGNEFCGKEETIPAADLARNGPPNSDFHSSCSALDRTWIVGPVTIGAVAIAGVAFYMGYIRPPNPAETRTQTGRRKSKSSPVTFTPVVTPDGAGATMRIDW
jgi:hypothetical protein